MLFATMDLVRIGWASSGLRSRRLWVRPPPRVPDNRSLLGNLRRSILLALRLLALPSNQPQTEGKDNEASEYPERQENVYSVHVNGTSTGPVI